MYTVMKANFRYQGVDFAIGDEWVPSGHPNDPAIIRARMVREADTTPPIQRAEADARAPRRKVKP